MAAPEVKVRLLAYSVEANLKNNHSAALKELLYIMEDIGRQLITYNHYFTDTLQKIQKGKFSYAINQLVNSSKFSFRDKHARLQDLIDPTTLTAKMSTQVEQDIDKFLADQALDTQTAY